MLIDLRVGGGHFFIKYLPSAAKFRETRISEHVSSSRHGYVSMRSSKSVNVHSCGAALGSVASYGFTRDVVRECKRHYFSSMIDAIDLDGKRVLRRVA